MTTIEVRNVKAPTRTRFGQVYEGETKVGHHLDVTPSYSVRIHGCQANNTSLDRVWWKAEHGTEDYSAMHDSIVAREVYEAVHRVCETGIACCQGDLAVLKTARYDLTFRLGDNAVYGSYNLVYTGKIVSIGNKTITVEAHGRKHRMTFYDFSWRNWDYNAERISSENHDTMMYI